MKITDRIKMLRLALGGAKVEIHEDVVKLEAGADGLVREACWFCGEEVGFSPASGTGDAAMVMIEMLGTEEHLHGVSHRACAERSKGFMAR